MKTLNLNFNQFVLSSIFFLLAGTCLTNTSAHPVDDNQLPDKVQVLMLVENTLAETDTGNVIVGGLTGPSESRGIASIDPIGIIALGGEFPTMQGRQLRARIFTIEPGGVVSIHTHIQRPGYAFIISGSIVEHRNDSPEPLVRNSGDIAMEKEGVTHWWENTFAEPVKALVVDIFTPE